MPAKTPTKKPADIPMPPEWIEGTVIEQDCAKTGPADSVGWHFLISREGGFEQD